jgi:hypothetical protein
MKQHVTAEQVIGNTYVYDQLGVMYCKENNTYTYMAEDMARWINIGKMIELLECDDYAGIEYYYIERNGKEICWLYTHSDSHEAENLCDALWEAVKEVLQG